MNDLKIDEEIFQLVSEGDPSNQLERRLKSLPYVDKLLCTLFRRGDQYLSLLMLAALGGHDHIVCLLLSQSSNAKKIVEQYGKVNRFDGKPVRNVTALWCACDRGHYHVARTLIELGKASKDRGPKYPLLIEAATLGRLDTVRFLIENGYANLNPTDDLDNYKLNCLIMAVLHGQAEVVRYLLERGADMNYRNASSISTPLGYAAIRGHLDVVHLLCSAGACSRIKNKHGQTPLMLAAKYSQWAIVDYLVDRNDIEVSLRELELVTCSFVTWNSTLNLISTRQMGKLGKVMSKIFEIRIRKNAPKLVAPPIAAYDFQQECQTIEEFDQIRQDTERLLIECLLIRERLLVPNRDESLFRPLLAYGDQLVQRQLYTRCLHLWIHTFYLYQSMNFDTGLHRFVWLLCKMLTAQEPISAEHFLRIARLTFEPSQQKGKDDCFKNALCLLALAVEVLEQKTLATEEQRPIYQWIFDFCRQQRRISDGQTLLHLCVNSQTYFDINYRANDIRPVLIFPNYSLAHFLLTYCNRWVNIDAVDSFDRNTPLHICCQSDTLHSLPVVKLLIHFNAHIDSINRANQTPFDLARTPEIKNLLKPIRSPSPSPLKCLCARLLIKMQFPYATIWSEGTELHRFLTLHGAHISQKPLVAMIN